MKLKRIISGLIFSAFVLTLAACSSAPATPTRSETTTAATTTGSAAVTTTTKATTPFTITPVTGWTKEGNIYTITEVAPDGYTISGDLIGGQIIFSADIAGSCDLFLNNVNIQNDTAPVIVWNKDSKKIATKSLEGTTNTLISGTEDDGLDISTIVSENNVDIGGDGTTTIISYSKHAIDASNIDLKSNGGTGIINISAASDGVHGKEVTVSSGTVNITDCGSSAISAKLNSSLTKGTYETVGGTLNITDCEVGIEAETSATFNSRTNINSCTTEIESPSIVKNNFLYFDNVRQ